MEETGFTIEGRVLCGDDACIGTIGPDRRCKVCGKPYEGDAEIGDGAASETPKEAKAEAPAAATAAEGTGDAEGERTCCPDDACVGIIGANGRCGVCGKTAP